MMREDNAMYKRKQRRNFTQANSSQIEILHGNKKWIFYNNQDLSHVKCS